MKIIDKILGKKEKGMPCYVVANSSNKTLMIPAIITNKVNQAASIKYRWIDDTEHTFVTNHKDYVFEYEDYPVYIHSVGCEYAHTFNFERNEKEEGDLSSDYLNDILNSHNSRDIIRSVEEINEEQGLPWKQIIIIGGIIIGAILLWQSGIIPDLLNSVKGSINPGYTAP